MWAIVKRVVIPIVLVACGLGSLVYGIARHSATVHAEKETEVSIPVPGPFGPGEPFESPPGPFGSERSPFESPPPGQPFPFGPPGIVFQKVIEKIPIVQDEPEWVIVREVTFGGITRLANGQLKRTYSGQPPALCPT